MLNKKIYNYFLLLFSLLPISIIAGPSISLANILIIDISFLILIFFIKDFSFFKSKAIKYLFILYLYLIFNSFISINHEIGLARNLGFIRFIILFVAFNYFFNQISFLKNVLSTWSFIIIFILFDIFFESYTGQNMVGYGGYEVYGDRLVSFFKDEPIVGGYIYGFYLIILGFLFYEYNEKKNWIVLFSIIFLAAIILTGERSNFIKSFLGAFIFYLILNEYNLKKKIIFFVTTIVIFLILVLNSEVLKMRYVGQIKSYFTHVERSGKIKNEYFMIYKSAYEVFKDHKFFGVGNKNYRVVTCDREQLKKRKKEVYYCRTHPHQIYFEFLSEHGVIGGFFLLYIFYQLVFSKFREILKKKNYIPLGSFIYLTITFAPLLPGGAFFGDYMLTIFMLNLSIFYASNQSLNIFAQNDKN